MSRHANMRSGRWWTQTQSLFLLLGLVLANLTVAVSPAAAIDPGEMFADPAQEARARDIGRSLRCLVCQNQSIFDSNSGLAKDLRVLVRERMTAGDTDNEVLDFIAARYGDYVLLKPPMRSHTVVLWLAPLALGLFGAMLAFSYHRGRQRTQTTPRLSANERATARRILEGGQP